MDLDAGDKLTTNATADDIAHAIDNRGADADKREWYINLDNGSGAFIESFAQPNGAFDLLYVDTQRRMRAIDTLQSEQIKSIYTRFLARDKNWRKDVRWMAEGEVKRAGDPSRAKDGSEPPAWAVAVVVGSIAVAIGAANFLGDYIPSKYSTYFFVGMIALPMITMIAAMVAVKVFDMKRSAHWPTVSGKVVKSVVGQREIGVEDRKLVNIPTVEYAFEANGKKWRGSRIAIGDAMGLDVQETLRKYPVGASVTVHYNPKKPDDCVLERGGSEIGNVSKAGILKDLAKIAVVVAIVIYMFNGGYERFQQAIPNHDNAGIVLFAACFGLLALMFFYAARVMAKRASNWPSVTGRVVSSEVVRQEERTDGRTQVFYSPVVEFAYPINGAEYRSRQIQLNLTVKGGEGYAEKVCARYPVGASVEVHYDPANPGTAALENPTGYNWLILAVALACFALAVYLAAFAR